ncbi:hypothetical protein Droror1_Dr00024412 [Drosera rotundifolia]
MHYLHPFTVIQVDNLRYQAMNIVATRLGRAEPPLRKEVVEYMLDVDSNLWSMRRSKANFFRIMSLLSAQLTLPSNPRSPTVPPLKQGSSRNPDLIRGIGKYSRSVIYHKRELWAIKEKNSDVFPKYEPKKKVEEVEEKKVKWYTADDLKVPLKNKRKERPTKLRASITSGTVLIILSGRFKGKRVVFLNQLPSGLLLVTVKFSYCDLDSDSV